MLCFCSTCPSVEQYSVVPVYPRSNVGGDVNRISTLSSKDQQNIRAQTFLLRKFYERFDDENMEKLIKFK